MSMGRRLGQKNSWLRRVNKLSVRSLFLGGRALREGIRDPNSILVFFHFLSYLTCPCPILPSTPVANAVALAADGDFTIDDILSPALSNPCDNSKSRRSSPQDDSR